MPRTYSQAQLLLPLLSALEASPGGLTAKQACDQVAQRLGITEQEREARIYENRYNQFDRDVRWVRQKAVSQGLVDVPNHNHWVISGKGRNQLHVARPGVVLTLYIARDGRVLWGAIEDAVGSIEDGSVNLLMTSPPYPQLREKQYGNLDSRRHVDWLTDVVRQMIPKIAPDGSICLNLGDVYQRGTPTLDPYCERLLLKLIDELGLHLAGRFEWQNPSKMPAPAEWCTVRRVRVKSSLERIYWLSPSAHPYASNRGVLQPYSNRMQAVLLHGGEKAQQRPSGHALSAGAFARDNGGAIPGNLITAANTESSGAYMRYCRDHDLPIHPARYPGALPEFFIKMLTSPGNLVADIFAGSLKTAEIARQLGRRFLCVERVLEYATGGIGGRLEPSRPDFSLGNEVEAGA